ncbi:MAG: hypothetical protein GX030_00965 [Firmicutes bacterium]|nr:hypothetical protein [Bacillota bacterium]
MREKHIRFGGVRFENLAPPEEINRFVRELPESDRESMFQVVQKLREAGLIVTYDGDNSTVDTEMMPYLVPNTKDKEEER